MKIERWVISGAIGLSVVLAAGAAGAEGRSVCSGLPSHAALQNALDGAVGVAGNGGLGFNMWGTIVAIDGTVCASRSRAKSIRISGLPAGSSPRKRPIPRMV